tara:strand:- start:185 stop:391 length:207 start_codon:yes stop_codon:yes gene_type:complete
MNFNLAMDLSNNMFAFHLCGVMSSLHENNLPCPNPEKEALEYLKLYHSEELEKLEADELNSTPNHLLS